jgi:hypothetical protein
VNACLGWGRGGWGGDWMVVMLMYIALMEACLHHDGEVLCGAASASCQQQASSRQASSRQARRITTNTRPPYNCRCSTTPWRA